MPALNTGTGNNEKTAKLTIPEVRTDTKIAGDFSSEQPYFNFFYINMITSHGYQTMSDDGKLDSDLKIVRDIMTDPFGGGGSTGNGAVVGVDKSQTFSEEIQSKDLFLTFWVFN